MPSEAGTQPPPLPHQALSDNAVHELATSNSTSNHFLGTPQRSWMTGGIVAGGADAASRAPRTNVDLPPVKRHVLHAHLRSMTRVDEESEVNTTRDNVQGDHAAFTAPLLSVATNGSSNPENGHAASAPALQTPATSDRSRGLTENVSTTSFGPQTSNRGIRPISETATQSLSAPVPPATTETIQHSSSANLRQTNLPDTSSLQTIPQADRYAWQTAQAVRFVAGEAASSPTMATAPHQTQPSRPAVVQTPPVMSPSSIRAPPTARRKASGRNHR